MTLPSRLAPGQQLAARQAALREGLLSTVSLLQHRRACEIDQTDIDDYVALNWLEWNGGSLRLTVTGDNIRKQMTARLA